MTRGAWFRAALLGALGLLVFVAGAALRPLFVGDPPAPAHEVMSATEIGFVQDMSAHHQQALIIAQRLDPDANPTVVGLARQIEAAQRIEIGTMLGWLRLAGATFANPSPMSWMRAGAAASPHHQHAPAAPSTAEAAPELMPGMATVAELDALSAARGRDAEVLFLQLMQRHHIAGVAMAQAADAQLTAGVVKQVAQEMIQGQSEETGVMTLMLGQLGARPIA